MSATPTAYRGAPGRSDAEDRYGNTESVFDYV